MGRLYQREKTFELRQAEAIPKNTGDFSAGFTTGWLSTKQLGAGAVAAAGDAIGNEDVRQYGVDKYKSLETQMQPYQKDRPTSVEDIKGVGSAIDWAQYQLGNLAPSMIESLGSALIGAGVGAVAGSTIGPEGTAAGGVGGFMAGLTEKALVKGYLEKQVAKMVATGVAEDVAKTQATKYVAKKAGAAVVMFGNSYIQGVGDVYGETMDANGKGNAMAAFLGAVPYAAIDTIVDMSVIGRTLSGTKGESVLRRYAAAIAADATSEGAQESGQEAILMAAGVANGQSYDTNTVISRLGNSFAAAALGGGAVGITGGHKAKVATKTDITQNKDVPFTDVPNPKAEEIFTKTIQALPEKTVNATVEGLARPMSPEMISSLSSEELQHVGIALNAAKEIPGANIQAIESNIQMIEATGNKIPTVQPAPIEIKTPATSVPVLTEKPVVATEKKVAAPVKETIASETKPAEVILQEKFDKEQLVRESENLTTAKKLQETMVKKLGEPNADLTTTIKGMEERVNSLKNKVDEASTEKKSSPRIEAARANNKIKAEKARISDREKAIKQASDRKAKEEEAQTKEKKVVKNEKQLEATTEKVKYDHKSGVVDVTVRARGVIAGFDVFAAEGKNGENMVYDKKTGLMMDSSRFKNGKRAIEDVKNRLIEKAGDESKLKKAMEAGHTRNGSIDGSQKPEAVPEVKKEKKPRVKKTVVKAIEQTKSAVMTTGNQAIESDRDAIEDFGEKIGGAKKELWSKRGLDTVDLLEMNEREIEKHLKKDNIWFRNYDKMAADNVPAPIIMFNKIVRDSLAPKIYYLRSDVTPELKKARNEEYVNFVKEVQQAVSEVKTMDDVKNFFRNFTTKNGYATEVPKTYGTGGTSLEYTAKAKENAFFDRKFARGVQIRGDYGLMILAQDAAKQQFGVSKEDKMAKDLEFLMDDKSLTFYVAKKGKYFGSILKSGFATKEDAQSWAKENMAKKKTSGKKKFIPTQLEHIKRTGFDYREGNTKDMAGTDLLNEFGFKGGEFGNWMNEKDRQASLNYAYDALSDLADALGIENINVAFDKTLSIAFGSRGVAGAAAHYEPDRKVFNLTKMNGAGSTAHEWWHGLEDYLATKGDILKSQAFLELKRVLKEKPATDFEIAAKKEKEVAKKARNIEITLKNILEYRGEMKALTAEKQAEYDTIKADVMAGKVDRLAALDAFAKKTTGRKISPKELNNMSWWSRAISRVDDTTGKTTSTKYYEDSAEAGNVYSKDGGYWTSSEEMLARAFASYITDKTEGNSDYLSGHSESTIFQDEKGEIRRAFPYGEERTTINDAFDKFFEEVKAAGVFTDRSVDEEQKKVSYDNARDYPVFENVSDDEILQTFSQTDVEKKIEAIRATVNPNIRKRIVFNIVKKIADRHGNVSWGHYNRNTDEITISREQGKDTLEKTIVHEIMHNAYSFFNRNERIAVIKYIDSLSLQEKRDILGKGPDGTWRYDTYMERYNGNSSMMAEEIIVTEVANRHTANKLIIAIRNMISSIIQLVHQVTGLLDAQYKGIKARETFYGVFDDSGKTFSNVAWGNVDTGILANIARESGVWKGKLSKKSIEKILAPINIDLNVTAKNNLRTQQIFNNAWRKLYKEEAPGKLADLLIQPSNVDVIHKGNEISFASGKRVGREKAEVKSREEKQIIREKSAAKIKEIRSSLRTMFKEKIATAQEIKAKVIEYVKENLPKNMHGKYLVSVKNARTSENLKKVIASVDERRSKYERSILVDSINEVANNIQNLPVDIQRTIIQITSELELKKHTKKLLQRLNSTKEYLDKQETDHEMPRRVLNELGILERTPFEELSTQQLIDINNKFQQYNNVGRNIMKDKAVLAKKTLEETLTELENSSTNMDKTKPEERLNTFVKDNLANPDETMSFKDKAKEFFSMDKDKFVRLRLSLMGMDRLFNLLDGRADYKGANYNTFKVPVDEKHNQWQYAEDKIKRSFYNTLNELKLTEKNSKRIAIYAYMQQRGGVKKLIEDHGYTKKQLEAIQLTEKEMAMYKFMRNHLDELHTALTEKMAKENNVRLGKQENYFPMMTNYGVAKPLLEELEQMGRMKSVVFGATKERQENAHQVLKLDAFQVFDSYVGKSTYFIAMDSTIQNLNKIASSDKYRASVGENAQRSVLTWLDVLARKGGAVKKEAKWEEKLNEFNNKLSIVVLGLRLTTIVKQPLALLDGAAEIGAYAFAGTRMILNEEWRSFIDENSSEMRNRAGGDPAFMEISHNKFLPTIQDKAMAPIKFLDQYTAGAVWAGAYTKKMDELGLLVDFSSTNSEALKYANLVVRKTQASGSFKDLPLAMVNEYRTASKLMFKFQTFVLNRWGYISEDLPDKMKNNKKLAVQQVMFLSLSMLAEVGVNSAYKSIMGTSGPEDKDNMFIRAIKNILASSIQTVPFLGQLISSTSYGSNPMPLVEFGNKFFDSLKQIKDAKKMSTKEKHILRAMSYSAGVYWGIPTEQARQLLESWLFPTK